MPYWALHTYHEKVLMWKYKTYFTGEITLHVAQTEIKNSFNTTYPRHMVCYRYIIVNTLHKGDNKDNNNNNNTYALLRREIFLPADNQSRHVFGLCFTEIIFAVWQSSIQVHVSHSWKVNHGINPSQSNMKSLTHVRTYKWWWWKGPVFTPLILDVNYLSSDFY
jgi:hypothetical protein